MGSSLIGCLGMFGMVSDFDMGLPLVVVLFFLVWANDLCLLRKALSRRNSLAHHLLRRPLRSPVPDSHHLDCGIDHPHLVLVLLEFAI